MNTGVAPSEEAEPSIEIHERLPADIDVDSLRKFFTLTPSDLEQVEHCRGPINRIGFAVQLCVLRWRGHFLHDTRDVPDPVLETIALQLGVLPMPLDTDPHNEKTRFEHVERIREHLHFRRCDATQRQRLLEHLITVAPARDDESQAFAQELDGVYATFMQKLSLTYYTHNYAPPLPEPSSEKS